MVGAPHRGEAIKEAPTSPRTNEAASWLPPNTTFSSWVASGNRHPPVRVQGSSFYTVLSGAPQLESNP